MTTTSTLRDGILFISLAGDLVGPPDTAAFVQAANDYLSADGISCAVDLAEIRYINSTGMGVLVSLLTKFRTRGGELVLINPADHPRKLLALTKLNNIFAVVPTEAAAHQQLLTAASS
ncbi:STAS domain-containing protein [Hymenobacter coccineus]|uniref:Anti-anti-sigma factor n=1 Tax=Hymenobacter coccineus TaxID=1908235 RepID=A0A1G1TLJ4_9BACT|nr:STAS domain-containing protein [Hymenobacter coccineus]OGX91725.1 anti-anti-sigma factor [Hymenobacter coccineus]